jgi:hypothetical protein
MTKELEQKASEVLASLADRVNRLEDFTVGNAPEMAQVFLEYGVVSLTIVGVSSLILLLVSVWVIWHIGRRRDYCSTDDLVRVLALFTSAVALVALYNTAQRAALLWMMPKLYILWVIKELT